MIPFEETIKSKEELIAACKKGFEDYSNKKISKNDFCMYFGFVHGQAITTFYEGNYEQLLVDGGFNTGSGAYFSGGINAWKNLRDGKYIFPPFLKNNIELEHSSEDLPLQQIFYGAPGTGKSHETNRVTRKYRDTIRTTFHPDSDYSTFVGAYKPTTTEEFVYGLNGGNTVRYAYDGKELKTSKIEYKFIPQAFIKAYIQAWKKMAKMTIVTHATTGRMPIILECYKKPMLSWKITEINDQDIYLESCYKLDIENFKKLTKDLWGHAWEKGIYDQTIFTSFQRHEQTVCNWIYQNLENNNFEEGWDKFIAELNNGTSELKVDPFTTRKCKTYYYHIDGDTIIINANLHTTQDAIGTCFEQEKDPTNFQQAVANCLRSYNQNNLEDAWQMLEEDLNNSGSHNSIDVEPQFLVIEEINRGNCAQIFGDLFQLLDRTKNGFSEYPIEADEDISKYIKEELKELAFNQEINDYINQQFVDGDKNPQTYDIDGKRVHVLDAILNGKILVLPSNLYIWATMNTSDQSLFPIDSAFKRRWDWEYVPIKYANGKWVIEIGDLRYSWVSFQKNVNEKIYSTNHSEDKMLGDFFVKADKNDVISHSVFLNKILFYLWNDVCKDGEGDIFKTSVNKDITFSDLYGPNGTENLIAMMEYLKVELEGSDEENESIVEDEATN